MSKSLMLMLLVGNILDGEEALDEKPSRLDLRGGVGPTDGGALAGNGGGGARPPLPLLAVESVDALRGAVAGGCG